MRKEVVLTFVHVRQCVFGLACVMCIKQERQGVIQKKEKNSSMQKNVPSAKKN